MERWTPIAGCVARAEGTHITWADHCAEIEYAIDDAQKHACQMARQRDSMMVERNNAEKQAWEILGRANALEAENMRLKTECGVQAYWGIRWEKAQVTIAQQAELISRLKQEAQIHAQEARTANSTIAEIYQVISGSTGEPGNWNGAEPVRAYVQQRAERIKELEQTLWSRDRDCDAKTLVIEEQSAEIEILKAAVANSGNRHTSMIGVATCLNCEIESLRQQLAAALAACEAKDRGLDKLARLGNEPYLGNSVGNTIAAEFLAAKPDASILKQHDAELIERCACACEEIFEQRGIDCAAAIGELKSQL